MTKSAAFNWKTLVLIINSPYRHNIEKFKGMSVKIAVSLSYLIW